MPADKAADRTERAPDTSPDFVHVMSVCVSCCSLVPFLPFLLLPLGLGFSALCTGSCIVEKLRRVERSERDRTEINPSNF